MVFIEKKIKIFVDFHIFKGVGTILETNIPNQKKHDDMIIDDDVIDSSFLVFVGWLNSLPKMTLSSKIISSWLFYLGVGVESRTKNLLTPHL